MSDDKPTKKSKLSGLFIVVAPIAFSVFGLTAVYLDPDSRLFIVGIACSMIFGFTLSNLARNVELAKDSSDAIDSNSAKLSSLEQQIDRLCASQTVAGLLSDPRRLETAKGLVEGMNAIDAIAKNNSDIDAFCIWKSVQIETLIRELHQQALAGVVVIDDPARELTSSIELLQSAAKVRVTAVSFEDVPFWNSPEGERFLSAHQEAIDRGIEIIRIFITDSDEEDILKNVIEKQIEIGVDVYIVKRTNIADLAPADIVIYDERIVRMGYNKDYTQNNMFKSAQIITARELVDREMERVRAIIARAERIGVPDSGKVGENSEWKPASQS